MASYYARRSREDPDDLLQEAWLGLLEALRDLDTGIGSPEHYLVQHARWRLLDAVRRARLRRCDSLDRSASDHDAAEADSGAGAPEATQRCLEFDTVSGIADFAAGLKATQRAVLHCLLAGLTWREAGHALGCSSANIAYHVRQIRRRYTDWNADGCSVEAAPIASKRQSSSKERRAKERRAGT